MSYNYEVKCIEGRRSEWGSATHSLTAPFFRWIENKLTMTVFAQVMLFTMMNMTIFLIFSDWQ